MKAFTDTTHTKETAVALALQQQNVERRLLSALERFAKRGD
jgi:hypothetical protein